MKTVQKKVTMLLYKRGLSHSQRWFHFFPSVDLALQLKVVPINADETVFEHMVKEDRILFLEKGIPQQYIQLWVESKASLQQMIQNFLSKLCFGIFSPASLEPHPVKSHTALPLACGKRRSLPMISVVHLQSL